MPRTLSSQQLQTTTCLVLLLSIVVTGQLEPPGTKLADLLLKRYLSNEEQAAWLQEYAHKCKSISRVFSIGSSVLGQHLWVLEISDKPGQQEPKPNFKYIANMHGDEPSGRVLLAKLAEHLCEGYNKQDPTALRVVRNMHLYIMPSMNPDGFEQRKRDNAHNVDLNRNFPDPIETGGSPAVMRTPLPDAQPETLALMKWMTSTQFTASANLHEGAVVANYPFDGFTDHSMKINGSRHPSPDDATFVHLAKVYAKAHKTMARSAEFKDGIVNGAQWYPVYRGMQDWAYMAAGCFDITLEVSDDKWRPEKDLPTLWEENRDALVALPLAAVLGGAQGVVTAEDGSPLAATIVVEGIQHNITASKQFGYYNRPLAPGKYTLTAVMDGYTPASATVTIPTNGSGMVQDLQLTPILSVSTGQPFVPHLVLRMHHVYLLALSGLLLCGAGGWLLLKLMLLQSPRGWHRGALGSSGPMGSTRREYELVSTAAAAGGGAGGGRGASSGGGRAAGSGGGRAAGSGGGNGLHGADRV